MFLAPRSCFHHDFMNPLPHENVPSRYPVTETAGGFLSDVMLVVCRRGASFMVFLCESYFSVGL